MTVTNFLFKYLVERTSRLSEAERELNNFREKWSESEKIKSNVRLVSNNLKKKKSFSPGIHVL